MSDSTRQQLLQTLTELSDLCPEMRLGQLIANLASLAKGATPESIWDVEDEELLAAARQQAQYFRERRQASVA